MLSATARANAGADSVRVLAVGKPYCMSDPKGIPHGNDPRALYAEALFSEVWCPVTRVSPGLTCQLYLYIISEFALYFVSQIIYNSLPYSRRKK